MNCIGESLLWKAWRAELPRVALASENRKQILKSISQIFAVFVIKFVDLFQKKR